MIKSAFFATLFVVIFLFSPIKYVSLDRTFTNTAVICVLFIRFAVLRTVGLRDIHS